MQAFCGVGVVPRIFGAHAHWGEKSFLIPSATIFFAGCTMRCVYCQNAPESLIYEMGFPWTPEMLAKWMKKMNETKRLQKY